LRSGRTSWAGIGTLRFRLPFGRVNFHPPFRCGQVLAWRVQPGGQNCGHFPPCSVQPGGQGAQQTCLRPGRALGFPAVGRAGVEVQALAARVRVLAAMPVPLALDLPVHVDDGPVQVHVGAAQA